VSISGGTSSGSKLANFANAEHLRVWTKSP
jgi:hypothetical protein